MKFAHSIGVLALGPTLAACATIISGSSQNLTVNANVDGAEVFLVTTTGETRLGTTPLTTKVKRGQEGTLRIRAQGYRQYDAALNKKINSVFWVNILSGGVFGSTTDYATGAMYAYEPDTYMVSLQPTGGRGGQAMMDWRRREQLRSFVLLNNEALVSDLAAGNGEYIDVLVNALAVKPENRAEAIQRWQAGYAASKTAAEFAQRMVAELGN